MILGYRCTGCFWGPMGPGYTLRSDEETGQSQQELASWTELMLLALWVGRCRESHLLITWSCLKCLILGLLHDSLMVSTTFRGMNMSQQRWAGETSQYHQYLEDSCFGATQLDSLAYLLGGSFASVKPMKAEAPTGQMKLQPGKMSLFHVFRGQVSACCQEALRWKAHDLCLPWEGLLPS